MPFCLTGVKFVGGVACCLLIPCVFEKLGDGSIVDKLTPVNVSGLTSGAVSVALGGVRLFA